MPAPVLLKQPGTELIPAVLTSTMPSRPAKGPISRRFCIEGGPQVGYTCCHAQHVYLRLAAPKARGASRPASPFTSQAPGGTARRRRAPATAVKAVSPTHDDFRCVVDASDREPSPCILGNSRCTSIC